MSYVLFGSGSSVDGTGAEYTRTVSSNLPVSLNEGFTNYFHGATAEPGNVSNGNWSWTNGNDSLLVFKTMTAASSYAGTPFWRYTGIREVTGGSGYFDGVTGSGIDEFYAYYFDSGDPNIFIYQGLSINRMSVSLETDAPIPQTDFRGMSVLVKNGVENLVDGTGTNAGPYTFVSPSLEQMPATNEAHCTFATADRETAIRG